MEVEASITVFLATLFAGVSVSLLMAIACLVAHFRAALEKSSGVPLKETDLVPYQEYIIMQEPNDIVWICAPGRTDSVAVQSYEIKRTIPLGSAFIIHRGPTGKRAVYRYTAEGKQEDKAN